MKNLNRQSILDNLADIALRLYITFEKQFDLEAKKIDLTYQQVHVLTFLKGKSPITMTKLAKEFGLTPPGMTGLIDRLLSKKLVMREYDPKDRRVILIRICENGKRKVEIYKKNLKTFFYKISQELSAQERETFLRLSDRLNL